jgi:DNA-binding response OmpR family regulator
MTAPPKILLISADDAMTHSMTSCLDEAGFQVLIASRGAGAIDLIHAERPILVILDIELPDYNSLAIIRALRAEELHNHTPVILMGASLTEGDILIGLEVGADLCLLETFHPQVFIARVRSLLRRNQVVNPF